MEIVAELSCNHNGSLQHAKDLITAAQDAGADAVKLQCWKPDRMVVNRQFTIKGGPWAGRNLYDLYQQAWTPWEWFAPLFDHAADKGIQIFSSVFDVEALDFLEIIGCPRYKIASFEAHDRPLVDAVVGTGKPVIVSTGLLSMSEVFNYALRSPEVTLLLCVSEYPAAPASYNLGRIRQLKDVWKVDVGVSDHTLGNAVGIAAAALGATMLEKHFQFSTDDTLDSAFSATPRELAALVHDCREIESAMGAEYPEPSEQALALRRSLWVWRPLKRGQQIEPEDVVSARPYNGTDPDRVDEFVGQLVAQDFAVGDAY